MLNIVKFVITTWQTKIYEVEVIRDTWCKWSRFLCYAVGICAVEYKQACCHYILYYGVEWIFYLCCGFLNLYKRVIQVKI